eukprot:987652-Rhodomonas_salina.4
MMPVPVLHSWYKCIQSQYNMQYQFLHRASTKISTTTPCVEMQYRDTALLGQQTRCQRVASA